ncbi:MAG TPA: hypothetical protein VLA12_14745 [Planctomycetaceae bacterium]|nr:hypothetical protein [Planctomycetaceae bacterium]
MLKKIYINVSNYFSDLWQFLKEYWVTMTPVKYLTLLIVVGVIGWILMRNRMK